MRRYKSILGKIGGAVESRERLVLNTRPDNRMVKDGG